MEASSCSFLSRSKTSTTPLSSSFAFMWRLFCNVKELKERLHNGRRRLSAASYYILLNTEGTYFSFPSLSYVLLSDRLAESSYFCVFRPFLFLTCQIFVVLLLSFSLPSCFVSLSSPPFVILTLLASFFPPSFPVFPLFLLVLHPFPLYLLSLPPSHTQRGITQ